MIFADLLNFESLMPLAIFGTFATLAWWALDFVATGKSRAMERLEELTTPRAARHRREGGPMNKQDKLAKVLEKATPLAKPLQPKNEMELGKLKAKLTAAGFRGESAGSVFLGLKFMGLLAGFFLGSAILLALFGLTQKSLMSSVVVGGLFFYLPDGVVWFLGSRRKQAVFLGLPDALDLMVVCVEAGLGLDRPLGGVGRGSRL